MNPLPRYEVTMFLRVSTKISLCLGEEPYWQLCIPLAIPKQALHKVPYGR
jgi:hypothetical protein